MKFTKDEAYKDLVAKLTAKGEALNLSERTAKKFTETLMKRLATDETELSDFINDALPDFKELDGQVRKDKADFIKQWNEEHPTVIPPVVPPVTPPVGGEAKTELEKRLEEMERKLADKEKNEKIGTVRSNLLAKMKEKGISNEDWCHNIISEIAITEDMDIEAKADKYLTMYNASNASVNPSVTPQSPSAGNNNNQFAAIKAEREKKLREQGLIKD